MSKHLFARLGFAVLIGFLFFLPHLVRIGRIGSHRQYTPFAAQSPSSMTWDETYMYASEVNYMLEQHAVASDTDTWEHRHDPFPYSILPAAIEMVLARVVGGLGNAQMLCHFLFPTITAWLLMTIFAGAGARLTLSAALALVLAMGFSPRTVLLGDMALLRHGMHGGGWDTMQGSRNPNPNISFPLFVGAVMCLSHGVRRRATAAGKPMMIAAGLLGGMLFYAYAYYAIAWSVAVAFLCLLALLRPAVMPRSVMWTSVVTGSVALPFLGWKHVSELSGAYRIRTGHMGMYYGHLPSALGLRLTLSFGLVTLAGLAVWRWLRDKAAEDGEAVAAGRWSYTAAMVPVLVSCMLGGIAGLNMQVVTGFNIQAEHHFPHMVLRPIVLLLLCLVAALWVGERSWSLAAGAAVFSLLYLACGAAQVEAAGTTAQLHRVKTSDQALFGWLEQHSEVGEVVATTDLRLSTVLPVYTHNGTLLANGNRTSASDDELIERYLLASALTRTPFQTVERQLMQQNGMPDSGLPIATYSYFLFEHSPYMDATLHRMRPDKLVDVMERYRALDLRTELEHFRVNYVWTKAGEPEIIPGWRWEKALNTDDGSLWILRRNTSAAAAR